MSLVVDASLVVAALIDTGPDETWCCPLPVRYSRFSLDRVGPAMSEWQQGFVSAALGGEGLDRLVHELPDARPRIRESPARWPAAPVVLFALTAKLVAGSRGGEVNLLLN